MSLFDVGALAAALEGLGRSPSRSIVHYAELGSTSSALIDLIAGGALPGTIVVASRQTAGRGRLGRSWFGAEGNLYISFAAAVAEPFQTHLPLVPLAAGVAAAAALTELGLPRAQLKWPNDVLARGRKLAGILCEVPFPKRRPMIAVIGLGANLSATPDAVQALATSLIEEGLSVSPEALAAAWISHLEDALVVLARGDGASLVTRWRAAAEPFGRRVRAGDVTGRTVDLTPDGRLLVAADDGQLVALACGIVESA